MPSQLRTRASTVAAAIQIADEQDLSVAAVSCAGIASRLGVHVPPNCRITTCRPRGGDRRNRSGAMIAEAKAAERQARLEDQWVRQLLQPPCARSPCRHPGAFRGFPLRAGFKAERRRRGLWGWRFQHSESARIRRRFGGYWSRRRRDDHRGPRVSSWRRGRQVGHREPAPTWAV